MRITKRKEPGLRERELAYFLRSGLTAANRLAPGLFMYIMNCQSLTGRFVDFLYVTGGEI